MGKKAKVVREEDEGSSSDDETALERAALQELTHADPNPAVNNKSGLLQRLDNIKLPVSVPWVEKLVIESKEEVQALVDDAQDDLKRELKFYEIAIRAAKEAESKMQSLNLPFWRPTDYYCEMVKGDDHMLKVKERLIEEQKNIAAAEERRKQREQKKFGKQVQAQVKQERAKERKKELASVDKWRQDFKKKGGVSKDEDDEIGRESGNKRPNSAISPSRDAEAKKRKREAKDKKYGTPARAKKMAKKNTAASSNSLKGFNAKRNKAKPNSLKSKNATSRCWLSRPISTISLNSVPRSQL